MFLVSKDGEKIFNLDNMQMLAIGYVSKESQERTLVKVKFVTKEDSGAGEYRTLKEAQAAVKIVTKQMYLKRTDVIQMPTDEEVKASLNQEEQAQWHHATGKKTKGHGGS